MRWTLGLIGLVLLAGCGSDVARLRARIDSIREHNADTLDAVTDYRAERDQSSPESPQIARIENNGVAIASDVKVAYKRFSGVQDKPPWYVKLGNLAAVAVCVFILVVALIAFIVWRSRARLARTALALSGVGAFIDPGGLHPVARRAIQSQAPGG